MSRINRGAMSRSRKIQFVLSEVHFICLNDGTLNQCSAYSRQVLEILMALQKGPNIVINIRKIPDAALVATEISYGKMSPS